MDFNDSPAEAEYRAHVRAWLAASAPPRNQNADPGSIPPTEAERLRLARDWQAKKAAAGFARITWGREWGGAGGTAIQQAIFNQEESRFEVPTGIFGIGLGICMPTLMKIAAPDVARRFVGPALRGEEIWCQLFSEPAAGSDLAGLRTRAVRSDDATWVVNGQKVWTTGAHYADFGLLLARTDPAVPKHAGLTMFWIDMKSPGVEVRPIHQMSGAAEFNEVYLTDVRVPDTQRVGTIGGGWKASLVALMNERVEGGKDRGPSLAQVLAVASATPKARGTLLDDSSFRQKLARWHVQAEGLRLTRLRTLTALSRGQTPGPESSIGKLIAVRRLQELVGELLDAQGACGVVTAPEAAALRGALTDDLLRAPGLRIAGGTDEILRNILAERVLGMPGELRLDKDIPFNELPGARKP
ncbi:MAG: acyl-CoA dehydrogenase family protein [Steroidobacteraceae bacterium]